MLTPHEARVLGCFVEKEITTPDQYPLSLNALTLACNQKTNRDPILELSEAEVQRVIDALQKKHLVFEKSGFGSRVPKYQHRLVGTDFSELKVGVQERAVLCVMLLRGPQTVAELRTRTQRLAAFADGDAVEACLQRMIDRPEGALVTRQARVPGEREPRYMHLLGDAALVEAAEASARAAAADAQIRLASAEATREAAAVTTLIAAGTPERADAGLSDRVARLEAEVAALREELGRLRLSR